MAARGHDVDVFCHANTERWRTRVEAVDGFRVIENPDLLIGPLRQGWDPVCAVRRGNLLFREDKAYDLIHCLDTRLAVIRPALRYARAKNITIVSDWIDWWGRGGLIEERRPWWYKLLFTGVETFFEEHYRNQLDGLSAISNALIDRAVGLGVAREHCLHIPGGANTLAFGEIPPKQQSKAQLGIREESPVACFSGLDVLIDLPMAIQAFGLLREHIPEAVLLLVGPTAHDARKMLRRKRDMNNVIATGPVPYDSLPKHLAAADVFLMPYADKISNVGRWPNKIGDYMCVGRPTVSNPVGEVKWLFEKHAVGLLCEATPEAMAKATEDLILQPDRARTIGEEARKTAEEVFAWDKLVAGLEDWYYETLERKGTLP